MVWKRGSCGERGRRQGLKERTKNSRGLSKRVPSALLFLLFEAVAVTLWLNKRQPVLSAACSLRQEQMCPPWHMPAGLSHERGDPPGIPQIESFPFCVLSLGKCLFFAVSLCHLGLPPHICRAKVRFFTIIILSFFGSVCYTVVTAHKKYKKREKCGYSMHKSAKLLSFFLALLLLAQWIPAQVWAAAAADAPAAVSGAVNGTTTEFFLNGSQVLAQKTGDSVMRFFYDSTGKRVGFANGTMLFYYLYNLQGDVIAIVRATTGQIVAKYSYDAWGKCTVTNATGYAVGDKNPFRYRGYYYDTETGLYYLNSRYYNPEFGRFISADGQLNSSILGYNLFAYCENNPICFKDPTGRSLVIAAAASALGEILFDLCASVLAAKMVNDIISDIYSWFRSCKNNKSAEANDKSDGSDGVVTSKNPPTENDGYHPPKGGAKRGKTKNGENGWVDDKGNVWVPAPSGSSKAHGGGHWDVNRKDGKGYVNIYPGGKMRPGKGLPPMLQITIFDDDQQRRIPQASER